MTLKIIIELKDHTFSPMDPVKIPGDVALNTLRASLWGTLGAGSIALISFIFSRYLIQNDSWKAIAPHVVNATLSSCGTFAAVAAYLVYKIVNVEENDKTDVFYNALNSRVSLMTASAAIVGLLGVRLGGSKFLNPTSGISSLAEHLFYPLVGLGIAGSILWLFRRSQEAQLANDRLV